MRDMRNMGAAPFHNRDHGGDVPGEILLKASQEMTDWLQTPAFSQDMDGSAYAAIQFLESNTRHYTEDGVLKVGPYISSHSPVFVNAVDAVLGKSSMVRAVYSQGLQHMLMDMVERRLLDEHVLIVHRFVFNMTTIELAFEMERRRHNPVFAKAAPLSLASMTTRFYASTESKPEMRRKALDMLNIGLWSVTMKGAGYVFSAGPVLIHLMDKVLDPFFQNHPTLGVIAGYTEQ